MHLNKARDKIWCHGCGRWVAAIFCLQPEDTDDVLCLHCLVHLGYTWDLPEIFGGKEKT